MSINLDISNPLNFVKRSGHTHDRETGGASRVPNQAPLSSQQVTAQALCTHPHKAHIRQENLPAAPPQHDTALWAPAPPAERRAYSGIRSNSPQDSPLQETTVMLLHAARRTPYQSESFLCTALVVRHRASPHDSKADPDLRNKAAEQKLTSVRIPSAQRYLHRPADVHKRAAAEAEVASSDMPESMSRCSEQKPCRRRAPPWPTMHPRTQDPATARYK